MRKNYLLMAAAAMLLASCSEEAKQGPENTIPNEEGLTLTALSAASQSGRVTTYGETRGEKSERLTLVAKVGPVADSFAEEHVWSATGIVISGTRAFVTWHSDYQAKNPADMWGGAIDVMDADSHNINFTLTSKEVKFNNVIAEGSTLYVPLTSYKKGAVVGRVNVPPSFDGGSMLMDTVSIPGSSANSVMVKGNDLYAISGYNGGLYSLPKTVKDAKYKEIIELSDNFGGKYIDGDYILRTDAEKCYIATLNGEVVIEGDPLLSSPKYPEKYSDKNGWVLTGDQHRYYGKHTMAVDGDYVYVAGGQVDKVESGDKPKNGLRVYDLTTKQQVWGNATGTTAVCVEGEFVYAATGAGLRVYKKAEGGQLELFAFEALKDENGELLKDEEGNLLAGTDAHSCNFIAVRGNKIFMANGQSGVYVFELDTTAPAPEETPE